MSKHPSDHHHEPSSAHQGHNHGAHHHGHHHDVSTIKNLKLAIALNLSFSIIEFIGAYYSHSTAILSDAFHDLGDTLVFVFAWVMQIAATKSSNATYTYGFRRLSLLSSISTALVLLIGSSFVIYYAAGRLSAPVTPHTNLMLGLGIFGVTVNGLGAYLMRRGGTLNEKVLSWHFLEDVLGWVAIIVGAILIAWLDLPIIDPLLAIVMAIIILFGVGKSFREAVSLFLQARPTDVDSKAIIADIYKLDGVCDVHDLHVWSLDGQNHVMTLHVVVRQELSKDRIFAIRKEVYQVVQTHGHLHLTCDIELEGGGCEFNSNPC